VQQASVVAVGPGLRTQEGKIVPTVVKVGDNVLLPEFGGNEVKFDNESFFLFREEDILGVVEK
jgi:chaperonin GroES